MTASCGSGLIWAFARACRSALMRAALFGLVRSPCVPWPRATERARGRSCPRPERYSQRLDQNRRRILRVAGRIGGRSPGAWSRGRGQGPCVALDATGATMGRWSRSRDRPRRTCACRPGRVRRADGVADRFGRALRDLRISVTDRCNFRCPYCMPAEVFGRDFAFLPHASALRGDHAARAAFVGLGVGSCGSPAASRWSGATCRCSSASSPRSASRTASPPTSRSPRTGPPFGARRAPGARRPRAHHGERGLAR